MNLQVGKGEWVNFRGDYKGIIGIPTKNQGGVWGSGLSASYLLLSILLRTHQRAPYTLIKEYSLNHNMKPLII